MGWSTPKTPIQSSQLRNWQAGLLKGMNSQLQAFAHQEGLQLDMMEQAQLDAAFASIDMLRNKIVELGVSERAKMYKDRGRGPKK